eukprot:TRINITY_DN14184_c0_g1_i2.p1 TRINITY_DN14184_c0_g1~~TRINITY_DN14184_c0_g1_i2.p1  ORF type:complete len:433 (-),score=36.36 TRINITY_DN14184_c0_g1_i2:105-1313(-)
MSSNNTYQDLSPSPLPLSIDSDNNAEKPWCKSCACCDCFDRDQCCTCCKCCQCCYSLPCLTTRNRRIATTIFGIVAFLAIALSLIFTFVCIPDTDPLISVYGQPNVTFGSTPPNLKVAWVGDVMYNDWGRRLYRLIKREGAEAVFIQGDLDYMDSPQKWNSMIDDELGADFPVFAVAGNHDECKWPGYQRQLLQRWKRLGLDQYCNGMIGVHHTCSYKGLLVVMVAPGMLKQSNIVMAQYLQQNLASYNSTWKACSWHKNQREMQLSTKADETGWEVYQTCLSYGAMVATGHEHSYCRSFTMTSFQTQSVLSRNASEVILRPGQPGVSASSMAFVNGLGGRDVRPNTLNQPWWATTYSSSNNAFPAAVICTYNYQGQGNRAYCYLKDVNDRVVDEWMMYSYL